ncbi:hypothetical protein FOA52_014939 [Chlamydomonas sp. UWO 241]|nr:hypothetical protein FOA52_014939 [Chlamydomonas sp. UWO 241]
MDSWICCDACSKWRRIPAAMADTLDDDAQWTCADNPNRAFASCSMAQELTNEQIDDQEDDDSDDKEEHRHRSSRMPAIVQLVVQNHYAHRKRKVQDEDDVMICQCKPVWRGGDGCGPDCINRLLCIECVEGFCPCEEHCTNQVFSTRKYARIEVKRAGAKGFGLFATEPIKAGSFIIEYVGEVLEEEEYLRRKEFYFEVGQRHYYFMNIGNGEVIDAAREGNNARFINHSCDPNCETQKWLVRGELAIGLFTLKDVAIGEELTFDYNFERYGDKPMRCYCGTKACRKTIGGTCEQIDDEELLVEPGEDAGLDLQPIMVSEQELDAHVKAILDWRVGAAGISEGKRQAVVARLQKLCESRDVKWTPDATIDEDLGDIDAGSGDNEEGASEGRDHEGGAAHAADARASARAADAPGEKGDKAAGAAGRGEGGAAAASSGAAAAGKPPRGGESSAAVRGLFAARKAAGEAARGRARAGAAGLAAPARARKGGAAKGAAAAAAAAAAGADGEKAAAFKGPLKAKFKQWASKQEAEGWDGAGDDAKKVEDETYEPPAREPDKPLRVKRAAKPPRVKRAARALPAGQRAAQASTEKSKGSGGDSATVGGDTKVEVLQPFRKPLVAHARPPAVAARGDTGFFNAKGTVVKRRSEVDRRLDSLVALSGRLKDPSRANIVKVLRMFNLCDIGHAPVAAAAPPPGGPSTSSAAPSLAHGVQSASSSNLQLTFSSNVQQLTGADSAAGGEGTGREGEGTAPASSSAGTSGAGTSGTGTGGGPMFPTALARPALAAGQVSGKQRARMADLSLLLEIVLKTSSNATKKEFITCGMLNQLHQMIGRNFGKEYSMILFKILRVVEALPLTADVVYSVRSAHGTFANVLQELTTNVDFDVRSKAAAVLKKYPMSACSDQAVVQAHVAGARRPSMPLAARVGYGLPPGQGPGGMPGGPGPGGVFTPMQGGPMGADGRPRVLRPMTFAGPDGPPSVGGTPPVGQGHMGSGHGMDYSPMAGPPGSAPPRMAGMMGYGMMHTPGQGQGQGQGMMHTPGNGGDSYMDGGGPCGPLPPPPASGGGAGMGVGGMRPGRQMRPMTVGPPGAGGAGMRPGGLPPLPPYLTPMAAGRGGGGDGGGEPDSCGGYGDEPFSHKRRRLGFGGMDGPGPANPPPRGADAGAGARGGYGGGVYGGGYNDRGGGYNVGNGGECGRGGSAGRSGYGADDDAPPPGRGGVHLPGDAGPRLIAEELFERLQVACPSGSPSSVPPLRGAADPSTWPHGEPTAADDAGALGLLRYVLEPGEIPMDEEEGDSNGGAGGADPRTIKLSRLSRASPAGSGGDAGGGVNSDASGGTTVAGDCPLSPLNCPETYSPVRAELMDEPSRPQPLHLHLRSFGNGGQGGYVSAAHSPEHTGSRPASRTGTPMAGAAGAGYHPFANGVGGGEPYSIAAVRVSSLSAMYSSGGRPGEGYGGGQDACMDGVMHGGLGAPAEGAVWEGWSRPLSNAYPDVWEAPDESFEAFVSETVQHRIGKYVQLDHPNRIADADARTLNRKIMREVTDKEKRAYEERQLQGAYRPIERRKLEGNGV